MDTEKLFSRVIVSLPIIHLFAGGLYIAGYSLGFGGNIGGMFSASDLFTVTIQHLITLYTWSLVAPLLIILACHQLARSIKSRASSDISSSLGSSQGNQGPVWPIWALAPFALAMLIFEIWVGGNRTYHTLSLVFLMGLLPLWWKAAKLLDLPRLPVELTWCGIAFVLGVFSQGMETGDQDRRKPYANIADRRMHCGDHVVLNSIGGRFLSVTPDNRRHLISEQCAVQFDFVPTAIIPDQSPYDTAKAKLLSLR